MLTSVAGTGLAGVGEAQLEGSPSSARFVAAMAAGEFRAIVSPSSWAASRSRSGGSTISVIMPSS